MSGGMNAKSLEIAAAAERSKAQLYDVLARLARAGEVCPTDAALGAMLDPPRAGATVNTYMRLMRRAGRIVSKAHSFYRIVELPAEGIKTAKTLPGCQYQNLRSPGELAAERRKHVDGLYALLIHLAREGKVCPDYDGLGQMLTPQRRHKAVGTYMRDLRAAGLIATRRYERYSVVKLLKLGIATAHPKPVEGRGTRRWKPGNGDIARIGTTIPDDVLYGQYVDGVQKLRRRGYHVFRSETVGMGKGRFVVGNRLLTPDEMMRMAGVA